MARLLNYEMQKSKQERQAAARGAGKAKAAANKKRKAEEAEKTAEAAREAEVNIICPLQSRRRCSVQLPESVALRTKGGKMVV